MANFFLGTKKLVKADIGNAAQGLKGVAHAVRDGATPDSISGVLGGVTISGTASYGNILTVKVSDIYGYDSLQWSVDGVDVPGATETSFTVSESDVGKEITVRLIDVYLKSTGKIVAESALAESVLIESFDDSSALSTPTNTEMSTVSALVEGDGATRFKGNGTSYTGGRANKTVASIDPNDLGVIAFCYQKNIPRATVQFAMQLGKDGVYPGYVTDADYLALGQNAIYNQPQWHSFHVSENSNITNQSEVNDLQFRLYNTSTPYAADVTVDSLYYNAAGRPTVCLTFDDGEDTCATIAEPYMTGKGVVGTFYTPTGFIGSSDSCTWEEVGQLKDAGWAISIDSGPEDEDLTLQPDVATSVALCTSQWADLEAQGLDSDDMYHMCYSYGKHYNTGLADVTVATMTTDGSTTVTFDTTYDITDGMAVFGAGVPDGCVVVSGGGTGVSTVVLSDTIATQALPARFVDATDEFYFNKLPQALLDAGMKSGRITAGGSNFTRFGFGGTLGSMMMVSQGCSGETLNTYIAKYELAKLRGQTFITYFHRIVDDPEGWTADTANTTENGIGINVPESFFKGFIDYIAADRDSGLVDVLTVPQMYNRDIRATAP